MAVSVARPPMDEGRERGRKKSEPSAADPSGGEPVAESCLAGTRCGSVSVAWAGVASPAELRAHGDASPTGRCRVTASWNLSVSGANLQLGPARRHPLEPVTRLLARSPRRASHLALCPAQ